MLKVKRPSGSEDAARRTADLASALDRLGVPPGGEFYVTTPERLADEAGGDREGPSSRGSDTSKLAALRVIPKSGTQRRAVLDALTHGPLTRDELRLLLKLPDSSVDGRVWELKQGGFVRESPETRDTSNGAPAHLVEITDRGRAALAELRRER